MNYILCKFSNFLTTADFINKIIYKNEKVVKANNGLVKHLDLQTNFGWMLMVAVALSGLGLVLSNLLQENMI